MQTCAVASAWHNALYGASPRRLASLLMGQGGSSARGDTDLPHVRVSARGFRAASVKLMSQPSIKEGSYVSELYIE